MSAGGRPEGDEGDRVEPTPGDRERAWLDGGPSRTEAERIRDVYARRDRQARRHPAIGEAYRRLNAQRTAAMQRIVRAVAPPPDGRLLDVGCGTGFDLSRWLAGGWRADRLAGVDLVPHRAAAARAACPGVDIRTGDGDGLPFGDAAFDVATAVTVFSSILDARLRAALFREMERVVRPGGLVVVYDFVLRKPTNPDVVAMTRARLVELAGRPPDGSRRLSPLLHLVAAGAAVHPRLADVAMLVAPPTHRLSWWRRAVDPGREDAGGWTGHEEAGRGTGRAAERRR